MDEASAAAAAAAAAADGDESEWEYEYSATETETHLITLDLSIPEFVRRRDDVVVHNTRGGFRSWLNPVQLDDAKTRSEGDGDGTRDVDDFDADDFDADAMKLAMCQPPAAKTGQPTGAQPGASTTAAAEEADATAIQILDLHTAEPIVAYRGMLFEGAWADTIGTEMLFAGTKTGAAEGNAGEGETDGVADGNSVPASRPAVPGQPPLPHAVALSHGVALVGASSARIACAPVELRDSRATQHAEALQRARKRLGFVIPVGNGATAQRQQQAAFLETLMAIKHRRGEADVVTVQAVETKDNAVPDDAEELKRRQRVATQAAVSKRRRRDREEGGRGEGRGGGEGSG